MTNVRAVVVQGLHGVPVLWEDETIQATGMGSFIAQRMHNGGCNSTLECSINSELWALKSNVVTTSNAVESQLQYNNANLLTCPGNISSSTTFS